MSYDFIGWSINNTTKEHVWKDDSSYLRKALENVE